MIQPLEAAAAVIALGGAVTVVYKLITWARPRLQRLSRDAFAARDAIVGRDPVVDSITGRELAPALPGIGQRLATVEEALVVLAEDRTRLNHVEVTVATHTEQIAQLQAGMLERLAARVESTSAFAAMEAIATNTGGTDELPKG